ncbi:hypothetical protein OSTOST_21923, partial [Ostertagia ostertagi]
SDSYPKNHLGSIGSDEKVTEVVPATTGTAVPVKSEKTHEPARKLLKKIIKATVLTFHAIVDRPHVARMQLLLCNISDRALYFKLKSNPGSNISAQPAADAEIPPHSQVRLILTWTRPPHFEHWIDVPPPKLLIVTRLLDSTSDSDASQTAIRLIARVSSSNTCSASNPPIEQLLLDAAGKAEMDVSSKTHEGTPRTSVKSGDQQREELELKSAIDDDAAALDGKLAEQEAHSFLELKGTAATDLEKEEWYHGCLPFEDIVGLLVDEGDFLIRGVEAQENQNIAALVTVRWEGKVEDYPIKYTVEKNDHIFTIDGTNKINNIM